MANYNTMEQQLLILDDGRIMVTKKLATQFDGMLYLNDACTKIYEETVYPREHYCNAKHHFVQYGVTHMNNIFQAQLQLNLNTKWKSYKDGTHGEPHVISVEEKNNTCVVTNLVDGEEESICVDLLPSGYWAVFVLKKKKEFTSPQRPRGIRIRGQLANGTARAGLKRAPADINTVGDSGVASGARPNPQRCINGGPYFSNNQSNTIPMDTTTMNIEQFHSPTNDDDVTV